MVCQDPCYHPKTSAPGGYRKVLWKLYVQLLVAMRVGRAQGDAGVTVLVKQRLFFRQLVHKGYGGQPQQSPVAYGRKEQRKADRTFWKG